MIFICYLIIFYFNLPLCFILKSDLSTQVYYKTNASYGQAGGGSHFNLRDNTFYP